MLHKAIVVLFAVAVASLALPSGASARGGHGGGFGHGGGGFHGGGFRGGGLGLGFYGAYGYPFGYGGYYYGDEVSCYLVRQRIHTRYGWRIRLVQICD
jgi:hypothetical protein